MSETPNKIIPNSFQTPNFFVDECMFLLTGNEYKCLSFVARKTFGWQKRSDRISKSQIITATGLGHEAVDKIMSILTNFGLVLRLAENDVANGGVVWSLQTDDNLVRFDLMKKRQDDLLQINQKKTTKARLKQVAKGVGMMDIPTPEEPAVEQKPAGGGDVEQGEGGDVEHPGGGDDGHPPQKPIKTKENMGAPAPAAPVEKTNPEPQPEMPDEPLEGRIIAFPEEYRQTVRLMLELFGVHPPEKPAPNEKGGEYALWLKNMAELRKIAQEYGVPLETALRLTCERWSNRPFDVAHPGALKKTMTSVLAQLSRSAHSEIAPETQETTPADPTTLPSEELRARMEALRNRRKAQNNP